MRVVLPTLALLAAACAGSGRGYPCDPTNGGCGTIENPDGGINSTPFISAPVTVFHDEAHNSSTDSIGFAGAIFTVFRHASAWSGDSTAQIFVLRSADLGKTWNESARIGINGRDPRQPKLFVFGGKLWVIATFWESDPTAHRTSVQVSASDDGATWTPFTALAGGSGLAAWRPRLFGNRLFFSVWGADELFPPSAPTAFALLTSTDAVLFAAASTAPVGLGAREGELIVRASGEHWMAAPERTVGSSLARQTFCHAPAGTFDWTCWSIMGAPVESPALFEWKGILYLAGKRDTGNGFKRTAIWQVLEADQDLAPVMDVPSSFADTGGPAIVPLDDDRALLTFHTTSKLDPKVAALDHEPTEVEAQAHAYPADVLAVELYMPSAAAGH